MPRDIPAQAAPRHGDGWPDRALSPLAADRAPGAGVVVTAAGPTMRAVLHDLALPTFHRWAQTWGWDVRAADLPADGNGADPAAQAAKWAKTGLLRAALREYAHALWLDADVLLLRDDEDITQHLLPNCFQALALEQVPQERRVNPNTGVWLLRSCPAAFAFLDAVDALGQQTGPWADQGAVLAALGWDRGDERYHGARPGVGGHALAGTSWLPPGWNQPFLGERGELDVFNSGARSYADRAAVAEPHALHFMGLTPQARYTHMQAAVVALDEARRAVQR